MCCHGFSVREREMLAYSDPEKPDAHVTYTGHGRQHEVHGDDRDENIIQWKNLRFQRHILRENGITC